MAYESKKDPYQPVTEMIMAQGVDAVEVTSDETGDFARYPKAITVDVAGILKCIPLMAHDDTVLDYPAKAGDLPFRVRKIVHTGSTATGIWAIY